MARQIIDTTTPQPGGKMGDTAKVAFEKVNGNFEELYDAVANIPQDTTEAIDTLDTRVTANEGDIEALDTRVTANEGEITALAADVQAQIDALAAGQAAGQLVYRTWTELSGVTGSAGEGAQVISDSGTHTDPVVGGTVANAGQYVWSESPAGWRWVRPDALALKADKDSLTSANILPDAYHENVFNYGWRWAGRNWFSAAPNFVTSSSGDIAISGSDVHRVWWSDDVVIEPGVDVHFTSRVYAEDTDASYSVTFQDESGGMLARKTITLADAGAQDASVVLTAPSGWRRIYVRLVGSAVELGPTFAAIGAAPTRERSVLSGRLFGASSSTANIAPDPFFRALASPVGALDAYSGEYVAASANSPFGGGAIRATTGAGACMRRVDLASVGVLPGDVISVRPAIYKTADDVTLTILFRNAAGVNVGSTSYGNVGKGSGVLRPVAVATVPAGAASVDVITQAAADSVRELVGLAICRGYGVPDFSEGGLPTPFIRDSLSGVNLLTDPWLERMDSPIGDYSRYFGDWANPGPNSPSGRGSIYGSGQVIRRVDAESLGVSAGDTITARVQVYKASGACVYLMQFRNAGNTVISEVNYGQIGAAAGSYDIALTGTVPSDCAYIDLNLNTGAGTYRELTATAIAKGKIAPRFAHAAPPLSAIPTPGVDYKKSLPIYGAEFLRTTRRKVGSLLTGGTGNDADDVIFSIGMIGDSWVQPARRYSRILADYLAERLGDAGPGWFGFSWDGSGQDRPMGCARSDYSGAGSEIDFRTGYTIEKAGDWVTQDGYSNAPELAMLRSTTVGNTVTVAWPTGQTYSVDLCYVGGSGKIVYSWDGGSTWSGPLDVSASSGVVGYKSLTGFGAGPVSLTIKHSEGAQINLAGVYVKRAVSRGVVVNKLGNHGITSTHYVTANAGQWRASLAPMGLDLATVLLGTNDQGANLAVGTFVANIAEIVSRLRVLNPQMDVVIISPCENLRTNSTPMASYTAAVREWCIANRVTHVDLQPYFGASAEEYSWLMEDNTHPSDAAGRIFFQLYREILAV